jgi:hypothetical protein
MSVMVLDDLAAARLKARALMGRPPNRIFEFRVDKGCLSLVSLCCVVLCR